MAKLDPLTRAAIRSGSDKYGGHLYTPIYHELFAAIRDEPLKVLEIGVGGYESEEAGGLGLRMWADYFPNASIVGLDIQAKKLTIPPRIRIVQGSQTDKYLLARLSQESGPFDIVIDDGSHVVAHVNDSFRTLYPLLAPNGIYAIEDTQTAFMEPLGGRVDGTGTVFELAYKVSLAMHRLEGYRPVDHDPFVDEVALKTKCVSVYRNIVVFHRGSNTYPSNNGLDFGNSEVQAVFERIAEQETRDPAPGGSLSRVDMLIWAGKRREAGALAVESANKYPTNLPLLFELKRMMQWAEQGQPLAHVIGLIDKAT